MDANDQGTENGAAGNQTLEALDSAADAALQRHPPNVPSASSALPGGNSSASQAPGLEVSAPMDREAVRQSALGLLRCVDGVVQVRIEARARAVPGGSPEFAREMCAEIVLPDKQANEMATLSAVVAEKWKINLKYAPEIALIIASGSYLAGILAAVLKLNRMAANPQEIRR